VFNFLAQFVSVLRKCQVLFNEMNHFLISYLLFDLHFTPIFVKYKKFGYNDLKLKHLHKFRKHIKSGDLLELIIFQNVIFEDMELASTDQSTILGTVILMKDNLSVILDICKINI
ncbi:hypothetical protein ACJX0J_031546, partial [Zea mays]